MNSRKNGISIFFKSLDEIFSKQKCIEDKSKYLEARDSITEQVSQLLNIIEYNYDNHSEAQRRVNESFFTLGSLKESYFELSSIYLEKKINVGSWIKSRRDKGTDNLTDFYWLESPRKIRNIIAHNSFKPLVEINEGEVFLITFT